MTPLERESVHRLAGTFGRLSLAAELVAQAKPGPARAALVDRMEAVRRTSLQDFAAAMEAFSPQPDPQTSSAAEDPPRRAAEAPATSTSLRLPADAGGGRAVSPPRKRSMAPPLARAGAPSSDEAAELARYGVRRLPAERVAPSAPVRPVPGVHRTPGKFFADKPPLPANRPITPRLA